MAAQSKPQVSGCSSAEIVGSKLIGGMMSVCCECCVLSGLCLGLITRPEESYTDWCVVVCDLEISWMRRSRPTGGSCTPFPRKKKRKTYLKTAAGKINPVPKRYSAEGRIWGILCLFDVFNNANSDTVMWNDWTMENSELKMVWKEAVVPWFKALP